MGDEYTPKPTAEEIEQDFGNLMAVINRDGGHKAAATTLRAAGEHCQSVVVGLMGAVEAARSEAFEEAAETRPESPLWPSDQYKSGWHDAIRWYSDAIRALAKEQTDAPDTSP